MLPFRGDATPKCEELASWDMHDTHFKRIPYKARHNTNLFLHKDCLMECISRFSSSDQVIIVFELDFVDNFLVDLLGLALKVSPMFLCRIILDTRLCAGWGTHERLVYIDQVSTVYVGYKYVELRGRVLFQFQTFYQRQFPSS